MYAKLSTTVDVQTTAYVDNPDSDQSFYDDVPIINNINFGMYVVPNNANIEQYMQDVDNGKFESHEHISALGYISSNTYISGNPKIVADPYIPEVLSSGAPLSTC